MEFLARYQRQLGYAILIFLIVVLQGCGNEKSVLNMGVNALENKTVGNSIISDGYDEIDYEKMQGEEYYFYLFADCFLNDFSDFLKEKSTDMSEFEESISMEADRKEKIFQYISDVKEKDYVINKYEFLGARENSVSFNDFMEVLVLTEFSVDDQMAERKCLLLSIQKYYDEENITWRLEGIDNLE